ncbi:MAG: GNAT family N-acetyltransferase [Planctomycetaceae bacterium]
MANITYSVELVGVDWAALKSTLAADHFDNGRSSDQLRRAFENSFAVCIAYNGSQIIGTARVLSDGVCNAYLVDVWTESSFRRRGIAREMIDQITAKLSGQHVYLQADVDNAEVYQRLGFCEQPIGMSTTVGEWLKGDSV